MNKDSWKRVLDSFDDEELVMLSQVANLSVPGFRQVNLNNIKRSKKLLVNEAVKPRNLKLVVSVLNKKADLDEEDEKQRYRSMGIEELLQSIKEGTKPYKILASLYSSESEEKYELAVQLEAKLAESAEEAKKDTGIEAASATTKNQLQTVPELRTLIAGLEKKLKKIDQKNKELSDKNTKLEKSLNETKEKAREEKKELNRKITSITQEKAHLQSLVTMLEEETAKDKNLIKEKDELLSERAGAISHLNAMLLNRDKTDKGKPMVSASQSVEQEGQPHAKRKIALLGNPKNKAILKNTRYEVEIFEASEFESAIEEIDWECFQDILLLKYKVPVTKQAFVQSEIKKPIKEVNSFEDLRTLIERGL